MAATRTLIRWLPCLILLSGCGSGGLRLTPVNGIVTVDGKPLARAGISYQADPTKGNSTPHIPSGTSEADGKYELETTTRKGAPAGWYKVLVFPPGPEEIKGDIPPT